MVLTFREYRQALRRNVDATKLVLMKGAFLMRSVRRKDLSFGGGGEVMKLDLDGYEPKSNSDKEISWFRRTCCFHLHCSMINIEAKFSEPLVNVIQMYGVIS